MTLPSIYEGYKTTLPKTTVSPITRAQQQSSQQSSYGQPYGWGAASIAPKLNALNPSGTATLGWNYNPWPQPQQQGGGGPPSYSMDPALAALFQQRAANRRSSRDRQKRDTLMRTGLWKIAQDLFGGDQAFVESIKNNPFSDMARIANMYEGRLGKINVANEDLNKENLFFSSTRTGDVLPSLYKERQGSEYDVETAARDALQQIEEAFMQAELQDKAELMQLELSGAQNAAANWAPPAPTEPAGSDIMRYLGVAPPAPAPAAASSSGGTTGFLEHYNTLPPGYSAGQVDAAARAYAQSKGYPGGGYVAQEGQITYQNGVPGIMIKYRDQYGRSTTEWTPLG